MRAAGRVVTRTAYTMGSDLFSHDGEAGTRLSPANALTLLYQALMRKCRETNLPMTRMTASINHGIAILPFALYAHNILTYSSTARRCRFENFACSQHG